MTKKRKHLYAVILILGVIVIALDRVSQNPTISAPATAVAASANHPNSPQDSVTPNHTNFSIPEMPFPENLPPFDNHFALRDIFVPPLARSKANLSNDDADNGRSDRDRHAGPLRSDVFSSHHSLNAILNGPRLKIAVIDEQWVHVGDILDGCKLQKIEGISAIFSCPDGSAILNLMSADSSIPD